MSFKSRDGKLLNIRPGDCVAVGPAFGFQATGIRLPDGTTASTGDSAASDPASRADCGGTKASFFSGNILLHFIADVLDQNLASIALHVGRKLPTPGDPSSVEWWSRIDRRPGDRRPGDRREDSGQQRTRRPRRAAGRMSVAEARMVLKVSDQVTPDEIVKVFRRLAAMHHPDRLIQSTTEERQAAGKRFAQIRQAFEVLSQS